MLASKVNRALRGRDVWMEAYELTRSEDGRLATCITVAQPTLGLATSGIERLNTLAVNSLQAPQCVGITFVIILRVPAQCIVGPGVAGEDHPTLAARGRMGRVVHKAVGV